MADTATYSFSEITYFAFLPSFTRSLSAHLLTIDIIFSTSISVTCRRITTSIKRSIKRRRVDKRDKNVTANCSAIYATNVNPREGGPFVSGDDLSVLSFRRTCQTTRTSTLARQWNFIYIYGRRDARANDGASCNVTRSTRRVRNRRGKCARRTTVLVKD